MAPKEKADELLTKYYVMLLETDSQISEEIIISILSKKFALIAVDEILDIDCWDMSQENFDNHIEYWQEVKQELNKI